MSALVLYHFWRSSASWRVRWALELKQQKYQSELIDLLKGEEKTAAYKQRNPSGYVPCLVTEKGTLGESLAIIDWLEENFPQPSLYPRDSFLKAKLRQIAETINAGVQPLQNPDVVKKVSPEEAVQNEWIRHWIARGLDIVEGQIRELRALDRSAAHSFVYGSSATVADLCLIPQCYAANRFNVDLKQYPLCHAVYEHALASGECTASHPDRFKSV